MNAPIGSSQAPPTLKEVSPADPHGVYLRRAARVTLIGFPLFALFQGPLHMSAAAAPALFAVLSLGSYSDFRGHPARRALRYMATGVAGLVMLELGTFCANHLALALAATAATAFVTIFLGSLGGPFYLARFPVIVAFLFSVTSPQSSTSELQRPLGWITGVMCIAVGALVLWPIPIDHPVRSLVAASCRHCARHIRSRWLGEGRCADHQLVELLNRLRAESGEAHLSAGAVAHDERALSHAAHSVERLASHLLTDVDTTVDDVDGALVRSMAAVLDRAGEQLASSEGPRCSDGADSELEARMVALRSAADRRRHGLDRALRQAAGSASAGVVLDEQQRSVGLISAVRLSGDLARTVQSFLSGDFDSLTQDLQQDGDRPTSTIGSSLDPRSLWFREAARYAVALTISVYLAKGVVSDAHSFWIPLGTYSVLRGSLSTTTRTVTSTLVGTLIGFVVSAAVVALGVHLPWVLWLVLPVALFLASSAGRYRAEVGAAAFTLVVVVLFSIVSPAGLSTGWIRLQDVALGAAVSFVVAIVLWPRFGAGPRRQLAEVVEHAAADLEVGVHRWVVGPARSATTRTRRPAPDVCTELDRLLDALGANAPASVPAPARYALVTALDEAAVVTRLLRGEGHSPETSLLGRLDPAISATLSGAAAEDVAAAAGALDALAARLRGSASRRTLRCESAVWRRSRHDRTPAGRDLLAQALRGDAGTPSPDPPTSLSRLAVDRLRTAEPSHLPPEVAPALRASIGLGRVYELAGKVPTIRLGQ